MYFFYQMLINHEGILFLQHMTPVTLEFFLTHLKSPKVGKKSLVENQIGNWF